MTTREQRRVFGEVARTSETLVRFDTQRYLGLLSTFSAHRMLPREKRVRLHTALAGLIDRHGGGLEQRITTRLRLARKPTPLT